MLIKNYGTIIANLRVNCASFRKGLEIRKSRFNRSMTLKKANVTLIVSDIEKSIKFYTEKLGFNLASRYQNLWAELEMKGLTIGLHPQEPGLKVSDAESIFIGFSVDDLDSAVSDLKNKGVEIGSKIVEDGPLRIAYFTDLDGYKLYLEEMKKGWQ